MRTNEAHITRLRGFAWYVFRDPTTSTGPAGEHPFGEVAEGEAHAHVELPEGVRAAWRTTITLDGMSNQSPGTAFLVVTETRDRPPVNAGWDAEPAVLRDDFQLEQRGDRWVHLSRVLVAPQEGGKTLGEYEFEVDHNWEGSGRDRG